VASLESLIARTELELGEAVRSFRATIWGDGLGEVFELPVERVRPDLRLYFSGQAVLTPDVDYVLDERGGTVTMSGAIPQGELLVAEGSAGSYFSAEEMETFVREAFLEHTFAQFPGVVHPPGEPTLRDVEAPLVAILATIKALWVLANDAATDIDVISPEGVTIPASQRWQQLMAHIAQLDARYREYCQALNVGLHRIVMSTLRRVSRTTNRLVPVYVPKEIDDRTFPPARVKPPIDQGVF
jgi:hypothetical protein